MITVDHRQYEVLVVLLAAASMVAVPVMKLFSLTVKTLAKPVAKRIKSGEEQKDVDGFRNVTSGIPVPICPKI